MRPLYPSIPRFSKSSNRLHPAENLFHSLSDSLTDRITCMPVVHPSYCRPSPPLFIRRYMRRDFTTAQQGYKTAAVIGLIPARVLGRTPYGLSLQHYFMAASSSAVPVRFRHTYIQQKAMPILHQRMGPKAKLGFSAFPFFIKLLSGSWWSGGFRCSSFGHENRPMGARVSIP